MADNYIENKMEEHRHGVRPTFRRSPSGNKPHTYAMPCNIRGAFIIGENQLSNVLLACARTIRDTSCRVAFCCTDYSFGTQTAQSYGLQFYKVNDCSEGTTDNAINLATKAFGSMDVVICQSGNTIYADIYGNDSILEIENDCPAQKAALAIMYLTLPQSISVGLSGKFAIDKDGILSVIKD